VLSSLVIVVGFSEHCEYSTLRYGRSSMRMNLCDVATEHVIVIYSIRCVSINISESVEEFALHTSVQQAIA